jgi:hypothetical protein
MQANAKTYLDAGCTLYRATLPEHSGLAAWFYDAKAVDRLADLVRRNLKAGASLAETISETLPNVSHEGMAVCSYDLRRAVERSLTRKPKA